MLCKQCDYPEKQLFSQAKAMIEKLESEVPKLEPELAKQECWNSTLAKLSELILERTKMARSMFSG
jgi:hypothetical protein